MTAVEAEKQAPKRRRRKPGKAARPEALPPAPAPEAEAPPPDLRPSRGARRRAGAARLWAERRRPALAASAGAAGRAPWVAAFAAGALMAAGIAAGVSGERLARAWTAEFGQAATLMALGPAEARARDFEAAVRALESTPGIAEVRVMTAEERRALLAPWLGPELAAPADPPPMAAVTVEGAGPDPETLALRLQGEAPGAVYDDHSGWRGPLLSAAGDARAAGWGAAGAAATLGGLAAGWAAAGWTAAAREDQRLLRRMGAEAGLLRRAWPGRAAWRGLWGGLWGAVAAAAALAGPEAIWGAAARVPVAPRGPEWLALAAAGPFAALAAWAGARLALRAALRGAAEGRS